MTLGERLKRIREQRGLTQVYVAKKLGIANTALSNYERGERDPDTSLLKHISELYGVSADYLLGISVTNEINISEALENNNVKITFGGKPLTEEERANIFKLLNGPPDTDTNNHLLDSGCNYLDNSSGKSTHDDYYSNIDFKLENAIIVASHQGRQVLQQVPPGLRELIKQEIIHILEERKDREKQKKKKDK